MKFGQRERERERDMREGERERKCSKLSGKNYRSTKQVVHLTTSMNELGFWIQVTFCYWHRQAIVVVVVVVVVAATKLSNISSSQQKH